MLRHGSQVINGIKLATNTVNNAKWSEHVLRYNPLRDLALNNELISSAVVKHTSIYVDTMKP